MRRKDREILDLDKIESIIAGARYMHLGMFDENYPYVVPLHYGYEMKDGKLTFYVHDISLGVFEYGIYVSSEWARKWQML